jgi:hypothetical protein
MGRCIVSGQRRTANAWEFDLSRPARLAEPIVGARRCRQHTLRAHSTASGHATYVLSQPAFTVNKCVAPGRKGPSRSPGRRPAARPPAGRLARGQVGAASIAATDIMLIMEQLFTRVLQKLRRPCRGGMTLYSKSCCADIQHCIYSLQFVAAASCAGVRAPVADWQTSRSGQRPCARLHSFPCDGP